MAYKIIDERSQSEALEAVATELRKLEQNLSFEDKGKHPISEGKIAHLQEELDSLIQCHHEFQREILESHNLIVEELSGNRSEDVEVKEEVKPAILQKIKLPEPKKESQVKSAKFVPVIPGNLAKPGIRKTPVPAALPTESRDEGNQLIFL